MQAENDSPLNIFLVDDDVDEHELFKDAVDRVYSKAVVTSIQSCDSFTKCLVTNSLSLPDIVFLDINMPRRSGIECLKDIRKENRFDDLPIVMDSNSSRKEDMISCYNNGANIFVTKPLTLLEETLVIKKILSFYYRQLQWL